MKMSIKRIVSFVLTMLVPTTVLPVYAAESKKATLELPKAFVEIGTPVGEQTPFKPVHKYATMQNSPDFSWPMIDGAEKYDLIVCTDEELTDIKYSKYDLDWHYYNFPTTFEPGTYWWAVRYHKGDAVSPWSAARRFRLDPDAYEFVVPNLDELVERVPESHPRIFFTQDTIEDFKKKYETETGKILVDKMIQNTEVWMKQPMIEEPQISAAMKAANFNVQSSGDLTNEYGTYVSAATNIGGHATSAAMAYIFTGDTRYADFSVECMTEAASWNPVDYEGATSFKVQDQAFFFILRDISMAYDWMYNYMTPEQRKPIREMLQYRFDYVKDYSLETIRQSPYNSHIWSYLPNYGIACLALMYEIDYVKDYYGEFINMYMPNFVPMSKEDGGWSKGTAYWTYSLARDEWMAEILKAGNYIDMFSKPWFQNEYLFAMYMMPSNSWGSFGDESGKAKPGGAYVVGMASLAANTGNPTAAWVMRQVGELKQYGDGYRTSILNTAADDMEAKEPIDYPRSHVFIDQGMTAMHSDLIDKNRTSLYFRAGAYGSYNHMECDQNAFFIESKGEKLASKSGWYDSYHSAHNSGFTRTTLAHNSVTVDGGIGQTDDSMNANGNTEMFVTHKSFDAVVGNATKAYSGAIGKFVRSIIYVRPETYIVVDDLKAADNNGSNFEWWLNGDKNVSLHEDGKGGAITGETRKLDVRVQYPEKVTGYYSNIYSGPDLVNIPDNGRYASNDPQQRIWFETERLKETKMITTMNVHDSTDSGAYVKATSGENYMKLEFEDGTVAYVSTSTDENAVIKADEFEFVGTAVVTDDTSVMLVGGTSLKVDGELIVSADRTVTVVAGEDMMNISSDDDYTVVLGTGNKYIGTIDKITDRDGREVSALIGMERIDNETAIAELGKAVTADSETEEGADNSEVVLPKNSLNVRAQKGHYSLLINDKPLPGQKSGKEIGLKVIIDGEETEYRNEAILNPDYGLSVTAEALIDDGYYYLVSKSDSVNVMGTTLSADKSVGMSGKVSMSYENDGDFIELKSAKQETPEIEYSEDYQGMKDAAAVIVEAENYDKLVGTSRLTQGVTFMTGISQMNTENDSAEYTVNIPESGYYDLGVRYASWQEPYPTRFIELNGTIYKFTCTDTGGYAGNGESDFDVVRIKSHVYLEAGEHKFTVMGSAEKNTYWNVDWYAFIKTE